MAMAVAVAVVVVVEWWLVVLCWGLVVFCGGGQVAVAVAVAVAVGNLSAMAVGRAVDLRWSGGGLVVAWARVLAVEWRSSGGGG